MDMGMGIIFLVNSTDDLETINQVLMRIFMFMLVHLSTFRERDGRERWKGSRKNIFRRDKKKQSGGWKVIEDRWMDGWMDIETRQDVIGQNQTGEEKEWNRTGRQGNQSINQSMVIYILGFNVPST